MRANYQVHVSPQFRVLSGDQIEEIYHAALEVLERVGTRIYGEEGLDLRRSWAATGGETMADRVRAKVLDILAHHEPLPIPGEVESRMTAIIAQAEERRRD